MTGEADEPDLARFLGVDCSFHRFSFREYAIGIVEAIIS
jgi:hypothetical protein